MTSHFSEDGLQKRYDNSGQRMVRTRGIPARIVHAWLAGNAGFAAGPGQRLPGGSTHHVLVLPGRERPSASRAIRIPAEVNC